MSARDSAAQAIIAIEKAGECRLLAKPFRGRYEASRDKLVTVPIVSTFCSLNLE